MDNNLPIDLVKSATDRLGAEIKNGNFHRYRNNVWDRVVRNFNNEYDSSDFLKGRVIDIKEYTDESKTITITDLEDNHLEVYCDSFDYIKNDIMIGAIIGVKGEYKFYKKEDMNHAILQFVATEVVNLEKNRGDHNSLIKFVQTNKEKKVLKFFRRKSMKVGLITSSKSQAIDDINSILNDFYIVKEKHVNLTNKDDIARTISLVDESDVDIILIARDVIEKLSIFNSYEILNSIYHSNKFVITALGHASFKSLADIVSDESYKSPSSAAYELNKLIHDYRYKRNKYILIASIILLIIMILVYIFIS